MARYLLTGAAALILMSGVAWAQSYPPAPPPMPIAPPVAVAPPAPLPSPGTSTTTTVVPTPDGDYRASTIKKGMDAEGNAVTKKDTYQEGVAGSTETHTKTQTDPSGGTTTTRSTTTTTPR